MIRSQFFIDQEVAKQRQLKARHEAAEVDHESHISHRGATATAILSFDKIMSAAHKGASQWVRSIAMTATAIIAGLLPIMWGSGTGSEVRQRIAAPMVGGMLTTTLLCLLVLLVIYGLVLQLREKQYQTKACGP